MNAIRSLKGDTGQRGSVLDPASRNRCIRQIVQLSAQWPDTAFHEHLYRTLIELGLENELLECGGSDLVSFLQSAGQRLSKVAVASLTPVTSLMRPLEGPIPSGQTKYLDLLAKYYVLKWQHFLAANVLYRLTERQCSNVREAPTLEQRRQYLSNAVLQAKSGNSSGSAIGSAKNTVVDQLLDVLEAKLAVLQFQMRIKEELELMASKLEDAQGIAESHVNDQSTQPDFDIAKVAKDKTKELVLDLKSITQLYNEYAVLFKLWEGVWK